MEKWREKGNEGYRMMCHRLCYTWLRWSSENVENLLFDNYYSSTKVRLIPFDKVQTCSRQA